MTEENWPRFRAETADPGEVSPNPDLSEDLGYELIDLDVIDPGEHRDHVLVMPKDEEMIHDDTFIIVDIDSIVDLIDRV